ncbi:MAG: LLM class flavin-dependent oxidoreductase [Candidatus Binatia bacterium]
MEFAVVLEDTSADNSESGTQQLVERARDAEDLGFDAVFLPDHYVFEELGELNLRTAAYDPFLVMAALAQTTKRIKLFSHVACVLFRHPAMLARLFAQIDEASGGRVVAGLGAGWTRAEFEMMGIDFPSPATRLQVLDETVDVLRGLWTHERFSYAGDHFTLTEAVCLPRPLQEPGPPIMLGGSGKGILERAGRWADIIHMVPATGTAGTITLSEIRKFSDDAIPIKIQQVRDAEAAAGRPFGSVAFATTTFNLTFTKTPEHTKETCEGVGGMFGLSAEDVFKHPVNLIGSPEEMVDELQRRREQHGLSLLGIRANAVNDLRLLADEVLPKLR